MTASDDDLRNYLRHHGLAAGPNVRITPLTGGVSSDIWLVENESARLVVKRAKPRLDVPGEWFADVSRNRFEQEFLAYVGDFLPDAVPRVLHADPEHGLFAMDYLESHVTWKSLLLQGTADVDHSVQASRLLATIHRHSWNDADARRRFDSLANFRQLRIEPYLLTTGQRHPALQRLFVEEARRLAGTALCLVHGDFSPKNIMVAPGKMVLLDCEVAWFGDPAFDLAFLLNHFFLKALLFRATPGPFLDLARTAWRTYLAEATPTMCDGLDGRVARLLLMLLLARIDGKSPAEYIQDETRKEHAREFVSTLLPEKLLSVAELVDTWKESLICVDNLDRNKKLGKDERGMTPASSG